jgi:hypothetical protein
VTADRGWVAVKRAIRDDPCWRAERFTAGQALIDLFLRAAYREHEAVRGPRVLRVPAGAILTSQLALAREWGWDRETVARFLGLIRSRNLADIQTSKDTRTGYTLITLRESELFSLSLLLGPGIEPGIQPGNESSIEPSNERHNGTSIHATRQNPGNNGNHVGARARAKKSRSTRGRKDPRRINEKWAGIAPGEVRLR